MDQRRGHLWSSWLEFNKRIFIGPHRLVMTERDSLDKTARELISLAEAAALCDLSPGHLRHLVREGRIWGIKIGRNWVTTAEAVDEYLAQDRRPGPKPEKG